MKQDPSENLILEHELRRIIKQVKCHNDDIKRFARQFYEKWVSEDDHLSIDEMRNLVKRSFDAAMVYYEYLASFDPTGDED